MTADDIRTDSSTRAPWPPRWRSTLRTALVAAMVALLVGWTVGSTGAGGALDGPEFGEGSPEAPEAATQLTGGTDYVAVEPARLLDTRSFSGPTGGAPFGPRQNFDLTVAGVGEVPDDAVAVQVNITATEGSEAGHLRVWPGGELTPTSTLNWATGETVPNMITVPLGSAGGFRMFNNTGTVHVIVDVFGYLVLDVDPDIPVVEHAVVAGPSGDLVRGSDAVEFASRVRTGQYVVDFDRDVADCAFTVSPGASGGRSAADAPTLPDVIASVARSSDAADQVYVEIDPVDPDDERIDSDFHLVVVCD